MTMHMQKVNSKEILDPVTKLYAGPEYRFRYLYKKRYIPMILRTFEVDRLDSTYVYYLINYCDFYLLFTFEFL